MNPLLSIPGYSPSDLQDLGLTHLVYFARPAEIVNSETLTPPQVAPKLNSVGGSPPYASAPSVFKPSSVKVKRRQPRSKASRLPPEVQTKLNTMLAGGCRYRDIIRILNDHGYPGFNKVNLNAWKKTGFQHWLKTEQAPTRSETDQTPLEGDQKPVVTDTNR